MKMYAVLVIIAVCLCGCSPHAHSVPVNAVANKQPGGGNKSGVADPKANATDPSPTPNTKAEYRAKPGDQQIREYVDGKLQSTSVYRSGRLIRDLIYNTETKELTTEIEYFYKENGELDYEKVVRGEYYDDSEDAALARKQAEKDFKFQVGLLNSKGIRFPLADIVGEEVNDLASVFSVADNYRDFKTESQVDGSQKQIKLTGFNKKIRFDASTIESLIEDNPILIKEYELTLKHNFPSKEIYRTGSGELTKIYSYKDGKLIGIVYRFTDLENRTNALEKRFEYHELK